MRSSHLRSALALVATAGLAACTDTVPVAPGTGPSLDSAAVATGPANLVVATSRGRGSKPIADQYIVVFRRGTANPRALAARMANEQNGEVLHVYTHALQGFAARLNPTAVQALRHNPNVEFIEQDVLDELEPIEGEPNDESPGIDVGEEGDEQAGVTTQSGATWGIDRIDQADRPLNGSYNYRATGAGVNVYIIDSGIRFTHQEFEGRATLGVDLVTSENRQGLDCTGHGSHVAGTVGGRSYGVAKKAQLIAVRTFPCPDANGSSTSPRSRTIAAVDWVTANHVKPAVANMSLGGNNEGFPGLSGLDRAVENSIAAGIVYAVAAGNDNGLDACRRSPARAPNALTVASSNMGSDIRSAFSNVGACVDLYAPGSNITSATWTNDAGARTISGTSMATPHVAGVAALYLQAHPSATPAAVSSAILAAATPNKITSDPMGTPNFLLHSLRTGNRAPLAMFSVPTGAVEGLTFTFDGRTSTDADEDPLTYRWTVDGSLRVGATTSQSYPDNGVFVTSLTVADIAGTTGTTTHTFSVANAAPQPALVLSAETITSGESATASATFSDAGVLDAPWSWTIDWGNGTPATGSAPTQATPIGASHTYFSAGTYAVSVTVGDKDGGSGSATRTLVVRRLAVPLDVRPGSNDNPISLNLPTSAKIPVAILGTASFDVRTVVVSSVEMGDLRVATKKSGAAMASYEDVNGDGIVDLLLHFERTTMQSDRTLSPTTTALELFAELTSGVEIRGEDRVKITR